MSSERSIVLVLVAVCLVALGSCSTTTELAETGTADARAWWKGDGVAGKPRIVIDLSQQRLRYYKGDQLVGVSPISSGSEGRATVNGKYSIIEKDLHHRSSLFGAFVDDAGDIVTGDVDTRKDSPPAGSKFVGANMRYFMRIVGGIGMHEGYLPGYPASHGCIRLPTRMAAIFFRETPHGTPVEIVGHGRHAVTEQSVPLGGDEPDEIPADEVEGEKKKVQHEETIRPALVEVRTPAARRSPTKRRWRKWKQGETLYLE